MLNDFFRQAVQLPESDHATLAGLLIETLDPVSESVVESAWSDEIERRLAQIDAGAVEFEWIRRRCLDARGYMVDNDEPKVARSKQDLSAPFLQSVTIVSLD